MHQFIDGSPEQFQDLFQRTRGACLRFRDARLPPGCTPAQADIAFESDAAGEGLTLLVKSGVGYSGPHHECKRWVESGSRHFPSLQAFVEFCGQTLPQWMGDGAGRGSGAEVAAPTASTPPRADLQAAQEHLERRRSTRTVVDPETLKQSLERRVHGQSDALAVVADRVAAHANRSAPRRPATLFFVGSTGVGKTRTAECLPDALNHGLDSGERWQYLRLDMNEYREAHRISQLIGSPQGYLGYGEGAQLTRQLGRYPRTVVLFDEIEKAHPDIFLALMNAMDSGRLSSAGAINGSHEIDCRRAIFVFTSNLSAGGIVAEVMALPPADAASPEAVAAICRRHMRDQQIPPELIGRISAFAVFKPINDAARLQIALSGVAAVAGEFGLAVQEVAPEALADIVAVQDARFGARADEYRIDALLGRDFARLAAGGHTAARVLANPLRAEAAQA